MLFAALFTGIALQAGGSMLSLALVFFVLAILAAAVGFTGVAGISMDVAKLLVLVFLILFIVTLLL